MTIIWIKVESRFASGVFDKQIPIFAEHIVSLTGDEKVLVINMDNGTSYETDLKVDDFLMKLVKEK